MYFLTSSLWLSWKMVWDLWHSWAKHELRLVIFWRPSYVISAWSGSISPSNRSTSTNALSNSFSSTSSHRNMDIPEPGEGPSPGIQHRQRTQTCLTQMQEEHTDNLKCSPLLGAITGRLSYINSRLLMWEWCFVGVLSVLSSDQEILERTSQAWID